MAAESDTSAFLKEKIYTISHPGISQAEMVRGYEQWCKNYDQDLATGEYSSPYNAAVTLGRYYTPDTRKQVRVLDVGAGTGLVGEELQKLGFETVDGLDPLKCMLDVARQKAVYQNYFQEYLSSTERSSIPEGTYDCVTASSAFGDFHIPCECLREVIRIVKPGGLIVVSARKNTEYLRKFDVFVEGLVHEGVVEEPDRITYSVYMTGSEALCYVLKVV